jgi:opacity protein-like surface antigen
MSKLGTALCLTTALLASGAAQADWKYNWLVGVSGGGFERPGHIEAYEYEGFPVGVPTGTTPFTTLTISDSEFFQNSGWVWGLFAGYQAMCNGWLWGVELNVDWENRHKERNYQFVQGSSVFNVDATYKRETTVGLSGRLGFEMASWVMPYIRAGIETSRDKLEADSLLVVSAGGRSSGVVGFEDADGSRRNWRFVLGIGGEIPVTAVPGLSVRAEYDYHSKGKRVSTDVVTVDTGVTGQPPVVSVTDNFVANARLEEHTGKISLVYNFM